MENEKKLIQSETSTGFAFSFDPAIAYDTELFDLLTEAKEGSPMLVFDAIRMIIPDRAQRRKLYQHCRETKGNANPETVLPEVMEILQSAKPGKTPLPRPVRKAGRG